ncbi:hypothetical protein PVBG_06039 [Plasmodium vivax Brazil I]|uniref:PIR Superfamily Protein n=1 Tax=Plasmodium vivax (strain Brazil I) TaxID=1033975 RepID=A0A0J9SN41_PLAV1|nr:hypothetical protein PVBG_06039 [Plasmodium vivax Brazil I]
MFDSYEEYKLNKSVLKEHVAVPVPEILKFPENILSHEIQNRDDVKKICITLKNYLLHFTTDNSCDDNKCCGYFNFWLNKNAREDESINETTFTHYKNCTKYYINPIESDKCISEIYYIEDTEFKKKQELYDLYDLYDLYNGFSLNTGEYGKISFSNICPDKYNDLIGNCKNGIDDEFCKELKNFENKILNNILTSKGQCIEETVELLSPEDAEVKQEDEEEEQQPPPRTQEEGEGETEKSSQRQAGLESVHVIKENLEAVEGAVFQSERVTSEEIPDDSVSVNSLEPDNSNTPKSMGTIIGTSLGFFIPLTMLYKVSKTY